MTTDERIASLRRGADFWNRWRERNDEATPNLAGADLSGMTLGEADLSGAVLRGASLRGAECVLASLAGADLRGVDLRDARLRGARLSRADLTHARATGADFTEAYLVGTRLAEGTFDGARLRGASLYGADCTRASFRSADLREADLREAVLKAALFPGANLTQARLADAQAAGILFGQADLTDADLARADLRGADLHAARIVRTTLRDADLGGADLCGADLHGADLHGTNLTAARFGWTTVAGTSLKDAVGLNAVTHCGPSSIALDTIELSGGRLPVRFLHGAGVPAWYPSALDGLPPPPTAEAGLRCLLVHARADQDRARSLQAALAQRGVRAWCDGRDGGPTPADDLDRRLGAGIDLVVCCSRHALDSSWLERVVAGALTIEERRAPHADRTAGRLAVVALDEALDQPGVGGECVETLRRRLVLRVPQAGDGPIDVSPLLDALRQPPDSLL